MSALYKIRRDTKSAWTTNNPVLFQGEPAVETDTFQLKIGDGATAYNSLAYKGGTGAAPSLIYVTYGDGSDGNVIVSSGVTTLVRDMYYNTLTLNGGQIFTNGFRIFCKILDARNSVAGSINNNGIAGTNAVGSVAGIAAGGFANGSLGMGTAGGNGANGTAGVGANGTGGNNSSPGNGGAGAASGAGGNGAAGIGGIARSAGTATQSVFKRFAYDFIRGILLIGGGGSGGGGSPGAGDGASANGGGGGGGGMGAGNIAIYAQIVIKGPATSPATIQANGGNGGAGGNSDQTGGATGGGGGAGGGGGGWIYFAYQTAAGPQINNFFQANGGNGAVGGNGFGAGIGGIGGNGAQGGRITVIQTTTGTISELLGLFTPLVLGSNGVGTSGGNGALAFMLGENF